MTKRLRVLIVDDEPLAREKIRSMLKGDPEVEITADCANGQEAFAAIRKSTPDLIFLDVQMPQMDGFALLQAMSPENMPMVIFVTAYDQYALKAFDVYALDYLLKPFDRERFQKALHRAKDQIKRERGSDLNQRIMTLLEELKAKPAYLSRLAIKTGGRVLFVKTEEIDWVEAEGNYVCLHIGKERYMLREPMSALENRLNPKTFLRIHRSSIVNIDRIQELQPWFHGEYRVILRDGTQLMLSRGYRDKLGALLEK